MPFFTCVKDGEMDGAFPCISFVQEMKGSEVKGNVWKSLAKVLSNPFSQRDAGDDLGVSWMKRFINWPGVIKVPMVDGCSLRKNYAVFGLALWLAPLWLSPTSSQLKNQEKSLNELTKC